ncbi:imidazole glycerol phosphate synthase subunit HisH [Aequorivita sp. SDUM287046]|uniref:Imidazole glycerol phosphate synthase subunit HisH n=1 Tax=Aequorivita aurantiaca TaxID=3053356 RepID=A0ABT8DK02_9FLAO|nr:imidazole glycerol phosphate synthase subunit HisH [Aequorivita aurantiaca]MDN3723470.1 imidazole glycerol phosphate synthase subunit HisH [Aequorivita aurantiaca]
MKIVIIDYGAGNIQSIKFAFKRMGVEAILSDSKEEIRQADRIIFPGVGEASYAMQKLKKSGLDTVIPTLSQPVLGICLGMQLLCNSSKEGNTQGMGIFNVDVKKFEGNIKVPQIGWNNISNLKSQLFEGIPENEFMYSVHSFYAPLCAEAIATSEYGIQYASALQKNNFYGVQFHPEKSSKVGAQILSNFLNINSKK